MTQTFTAGQTLTSEAVNAELAFPTGSMIPFAGASAPAQTIGGVSAWLICDGSAVSRTTYADLFATCSTTYGVGDGSTTFNLPDLRGRMPIGAGDEGVAANNEARTLGDKGGDTRLQSHAHTYPWNNAGNGAGGVGVVRLDAFAGNMASSTTGSGTGENMPPFIVTNYIIKT